MDYGLSIIDRIVPKYGNRVGCVIVSAVKSWVRVTVYKIYVDYPLSMQY